MRLVELVNPTSQVVAPGAFVVLGTVDKANVNYVLVGTTGIQINAAGYYELEWTGTIEATAANQSEFDILADGVPVAYAFVYQAAAGNIDTVSTSKIIRVYCGSSSTISIRNNATTPSTVNLSNLIIKKVG